MGEEFKMKQWEIQSTAVAMGNLRYLIHEQYFGRIKEDITIVLNHEEVLKFIGELDQSLYAHSALEVAGDYFYLTSSVSGSFFICENAIDEDGEAIWHETDILILPHYVPDNIREACIRGSRVAIELIFKDSYENLIELINS